MPPGEKCIHLSQWKSLGASLSSAPSGAEFSLPKVGVPLRSHSLQLVSEHRTVMGKRAGAWR